jgi:hypothetical protein
MKLFASENTLRAPCYQLRFFVPEKTARKQQSKDKWNAVTGINRDTNRRFSWMAEYNGFTGSRDAFITSLEWTY